MIKNILVCLVALTTADLASAMTAEENKIVRESVLELCRGGSLEGKTSSVLVKGEGKVTTTVLFKKLVEAGLNGTAEFSKAEWEGIKPLLPETFDSKAYVECVKVLTPQFLDKYSSAPTSYSESVNITGKWMYPDKAHYWVVRPGGSSTGFTIELYTSDNRSVGDGTATVSGNIVNFSLRSTNHYVGNTLHMMHGETNGRLEYEGNQLSGQTDQLDLEYLEDPSSIDTFILFRAQ